jgi:hypothetical protein
MYIQPIWVNADVSTTPSPPPAGYFLDRRPLRGAAAAKMLATFATASLFRPVLRLLINRPRFSEADDMSVVCRRCRPPKLSAAGDAVLLLAGLGGIMLLGEQFEAHRLRAFIFNFEIARHRGSADV